MLAQPLPKRLDVRKMARKDVVFSGDTPLNSFSRLEGLIESQDGSLSYQLQVEVEQGGHIVLRGSLKADLQVLCQRCLKAMPYQLDTEMALGIVRNDEASQQLPKSLDPWVLEEDEADMYGMLEDELILALPAVHFHPQNECEGLSSYQAGDVSEFEEKQAEEKPNPFAELEKLKN